MRISREYRRLTPKTAAAAVSAAAATAISARPRRPSSYSPRKTLTPAAAPQAMTLVHNWVCASVMVSTMMQAIIRPFAQRRRLMQNSYAAKIDTNTDDRPAVFVLLNARMRDVISPGATMPTGRVSFRNWNGRPTNTLVSPISIIGVTQISSSTATARISCRSRSGPPLG